MDELKKNIVLEMKIERGRLIAQPLAAIWPDLAAAALRAIEEAGFAIVPKEPTKAMLRDSSAPEVDRMIWSDMVAASQGGSVKRMAEFDDGNWETVESESAALNLEEPRG